MASVFFDVLNKIVNDSGIHPRLTSERGVVRLTSRFNSEVLKFDHA